MQSEFRRTANASTLIAYGQFCSFQQNVLPVFSQIQHKNGSAGQADWDALVSKVDSLTGRVEALETPSYLKDSEGWCALSSLSDYHPQTRNKFTSDELLTFGVGPILIRVNFEIGNAEIRYHNYHEDLYLIEVYDRNCALIDSRLVQDSE